MHAVTVSEEAIAGDASWFTVAKGAHRDFKNRELRKRTSLRNMHVWSVSPSLELITVAGASFRWRLVSLSLSLSLTLSFFFSGCDEMKRPEAAGL